MTKTFSLNVTTIMAAITTIVGLAVTQGFITDHTAQLVTGLASAFAPVIILVAHTFFHANVSAAKIRAGK